MEGVTGLVERNEGVEGNQEWENGCCNADETVGDLMKEKGSRESSSSSEIEEQSQSSAEDSSSSTSIEWPVQEISASNCTSPRGNEDAVKKHLSNEKRFSVSPMPELEIEMMKEKFAKLLLGEDMSGCGNGVSTALAISNAITNLCATLFGQLWRLEPLPQEKKAMWRREMECLTCISDLIVELKPTWQSFPDGSKLEVMTSRPRSDLYVNIPALRKLDNMLLEILDSFVNPEFWYVDQGVVAADGDGSSSFRRAGQEEKWWLPVPQVSPSGLHENSRKQLQHKRDSTNQILKAAMAINSISLADMQIPHTYLESLPKTARASLGEFIYRNITSDNFSPEYLLATLDLKSEHEAIEIANRVEASIYIWQKGIHSKPTSRFTKSSSRSSWEMFRDLIVEGETREVLAERAETLLLFLKQRFPGLPQTTLDMTKIQCNKDVGKSILESYSRVLESLASNILARIGDVLYVDDMTKHSDQFSSLSKVGAIAHKSISVPYSVLVQRTPHKSPFGTPSFSSVQGISVAKTEDSPFVKKRNLPQQRVGVHKVLTNFGSFDRNHSKFVPTLKPFEEVPAAFETDMEFSDCTEKMRRSVLSTEQG